ncbi:hypothetical protein K443DRAFT_14656 [Laccaria amethystina LaAM-08-1]|uniref:Uncharacterized protein n=1 Tax=Laccaria amethystina LaAM-08-1 TaxID=1095629 RepID=A0A0C9X0Q9_9AGAR|nr:hypothetical protein K443DRAFT_14656 [Laccaria amethystina LaAM-08-1]
MPRHTTPPTTQNPSQPKTTKRTRSERDRPLTTTNQHQNEDDHPYRSRTTASAYKRRGATTNAQDDTHELRPPPLPINEPERQRPTTIHGRRPRTTATTIRTIPKRRQAPTHEERLAPPHHERGRVPYTTACPSPLL